MDQKRYFIGIQLPGALTHAISTLQKNAYNEQSMLTPLIPHITLLHPNALTSLAPMYFIPLVSKVAAQHLPFDVTLTHLGAFGSSVLYIAVESHGLMRLHKALVALLPEKVRTQYYVSRSFTPHVTLAQAKFRIKLSQPESDSFNTALEQKLPYTFPVNHLSEFVWQDARKYKIATIV